MTIFKIIIIIFVLLFIFITIRTFFYQEVAPKVEGVIVNNDGPVRGLEITRITEKTDKKISAITDENGNIKFPSERAFMAPLSHISEPSFEFKYKDRELTTSLYMPNVNSSEIEKTYEGNKVKWFKINIDKVYERIKSYEE